MNLSMFESLPSAGDEDPALICLGQLFVVSAQGRVQEVKWLAVFATFENLRNTKKTPLSGTSETF